MGRRIDIDRRWRVGDDGGAGSATSRANDTAAPPWTIRRSPVPLAVAAIVVVALGGWALRTWGPINPAVTMVDAQQSIDGSGAWTASVLVINEARAPIEIVDVSTSPESADGASGATGHQVTDVTVTAQADDGGPLPGSHPLPASVPGGSRVLVTATLSSEPGCAPASVCSPSISG